MFASTLTTLKSRTKQLLRGAEDDVANREDDDFDEFSQMPNIEDFTGFGAALEQAVLVRYGIQNGRNSEKAGSAFLLAVEGGQVTVGLIKAQFPLPGRFHLRFRAPDPDPAACRMLWLDLDDNQDPVPVFRNEVHMKALLVPDGCASRKVEFGQMVRSCFGTAELCAPPHRVPPGGSGHGWDGGPRLRSPAGAVEAGTGLRKKGSVDDEGSRDGTNDATPKTFPVVEPHRTPTPVTPPPQPSPIIDLFDFGQQPAPPGEGAIPSCTPSSAPPPSRVFDRDQLVREREAGVQECVEHAKRKYLEAQQKETELREAKLCAANKLSGEIDKWAKMEKTWKDIRTLLSTCHEVSWQGCEWRPVTMSELMAPNTVKTKYRKAILVYHPDKQKEAPPEQQYRAERIFEALNESFKMFQQ